jgi:hypothetical protein
VQAFALEERVPREIENPLSQIPCIIERASERAVGSQSLEQGPGSTGVHGRDVLGCEEEAGLQDEEWILDIHGFVAPGQVSMKAGALSVLVPLKPYAEGPRFVRIQLQGFGLLFTAGVQIGAPGFTEKGDDLRGFGIIEPPGAAASEA